MVSVIIPVYNGEHYLAQAIESVLAQGYEPLEIIVIDDGSTDASAQIAQSFPQVNYHYQTNQGLGAALNHGLEVAAGKFITFIDVDDLWGPNKLIRQMAYFQEHPECQIVIGRTEFAYSGGARPRLLEDGRVIKVITSTTLGGGLYRRSVYETVGKFEIASAGLDVDWFIRAEEAGQVLGFIDDVVLIYRLHGKNMTTEVENVKASITRIVRARLNRRRDGKVEANRAFLAWVKVHETMTLEQFRTHVD